MSLRPPIPSYAQPPVDEVALAAYFAPAIDLRSVHFGQLWEQWRDRYPRSADQPLLPPIRTEGFGRSVGIEIQLVPGTLGPRVWYVSDDGSRVLQVQRDRLVLNWRRTTPGREYPRYDSLRPAFEEALQKLLAFAGEQGLGTPVIRHVEVTYVNPIPVATVAQARGIAGLLAPWSGKFSDDFLPEPSDAQLFTRYSIPGEDGSQIGWLNVVARSALQQPVGTATEPEDVYLLRLYARGRPLHDGVGGALRFLDIGHEWVVRGFTSVTTASMHEVWRRER